MWTVCSLFCLTDMATLVNQTAIVIHILQKCSFVFVVVAIIMSNKS